MKFIIGADIVPTNSNIQLFERGNSAGLIGDKLLTLLDDADYTLFNLEVPLTDKATPIEKCGPNLIAPTSTIVGLKVINPHFFTLANNHILDQGKQGLYSTMEQLTKHGISYAGVGENLKAAEKPYVFENDGLRIGIYCCTEREFSIATENTPGANPFEPLESPDHIAALKAECDYVIALYHGGKEHYRYPSPYLQKVCRKMAEKGADFVVCQHSHCIGCFEEYKGSTIVYGQGNFLFDGSDSEFWKTNLLIKISIGNGYQIGYIPIVKAGNGVRLADEETTEEILSAFYRRSEEIRQNGFIERHYNQFAKDNYFSYIRSLAGYGKWLSRIDNRLLNGMLSKRKYTKKRLLKIQNYIECEAHRELILKGLNCSAKEK